MGKISTVARGTTKTGKVQTSMGPKGGKGAAKGGKKGKKMGKC